MLLESTPSALHMQLPAAFAKVSNSRRPPEKPPNPSTCMLHVNHGAPHAPLPFAGDAAGSASVVGDVSIGVLEVFAPDLH